MFTKYRLKWQRCCKLTRSLATKYAICSHTNEQFHVKLNRFVTWSKCSLIWRTLSGQRTSHRLSLELAVFEAEVDYQFFDVNATNQRKHQTIWRNVGQSFEEMLFISWSGLIKTRDVFIINDCFKQSRCILLYRSVRLCVYTEKCV